MKNLKYFKILGWYLKDDKLKLIIYIFLTFFLCFQSLFYPLLWAKALNALMNRDWQIFIIYLSAWDGLAILCNNILTIPKDIYHNYLELKFMNTVSKDLFKKVLDLPTKAFEDLSVGEITNRIYSDPDRIMELLSRLIKLASRLITVIIVVFISAKVSLIITTELLVFVMVIYILSNVFYPKIKKTQERIKTESDDYVKETSQTLNGIREIKALGIKNNVLKIIHHNIDSLFKEQKTVRKQELYYQYAIDFFYLILEGVILFTCGLLFYQGKIPFEMFIMMEMYIWRISEAVESFSDFGISFQKMIVSLKRIDEITNNVFYQDEVFGNKILKKVKGTIEFKDISFRYGQDENLTLNNLNMILEPHKKIAIVGRSGMGKSTIFNLLLRYFEPNKGKILIDGQNLTKLTEAELRNKISIIRQNPYLFNKTIIENFALIKEDVTLEEIKTVCQKAYIHDYIESLPNKYDTLIGEAGVNLSGGQKQRLAIARTLLKDTKIILFDEATSALDNESQEYIKKTINDLVVDHTIVIVAHRLSTIMDADEIFIIDEGQVVAKGSHQELLTDSNIYQRLYNPETQN